MAYKVWNGFIEFAMMIDSNTKIYNDSWASCAFGDYCSSIEVKAYRHIERVRNTMQDEYGLSDDDIEDINKIRNITYSSNLPSHLASIPDVMLYCKLNVGDFDTYGELQDYITDSI